VETADSQSGVAGGQIEIQLPAGWQPLPTVYHASTGELTATVPDDGSIPDGIYPLRAIVTDAVGNQATITTDADGSTETVSLPLRIVTQLHVGDATALAKRCTLTRLTLPAANPKIVDQRPRAQLVKHCTTVTVPRSHGPLTLAYGQLGSVQGLLQTADGQPIAGAHITATAQPSGWPTQPAGSATTDLQGRFAYQLRPGPSRTITFAFAGTSTLRGTTATSSALVAGKATITATTTARAGRALLLSGRLFGGYIPPRGTLIQLQYRITGFPQHWAPFDVLVRAHRNGTWSTSVPLPSSAAGYTYQIRAVVTTQTDWPYTQTTTNTITRHILP